MHEQLDSFFSHYPRPIKKLLRFLSEHHLELYLVGGAVRDFIDSGQFGHDHDFEIQSSKKISLSEWKAHIDEVMRKACAEFELPVECLKFHIHRLKYEEFDLEFAPAREEAYSDKQEVYGHSDFKAKLLVQAPPEKSWRRRDFTVNAMGIHFDLSGPRSKAHFLDPFAGLVDLKSRTLRAVGHDFTKDPVRFVRSLRFSRKLRCNFGRDLKDKLKAFNLERLSFEALKRECLKDFAPVEFLVEFFKMTQEFQVNVPGQMLSLQSSVLKVQDMELSNWKRPELYSVLEFFWRQGLDWDEGEFLAFTLFWGGKKKEALRVFKIQQVIQHLPEELLRLESAQEIRRHPYYGQLKKLVDFFESDSWSTFAGAIPNACRFAGLKKLDPQEFQVHVKKKLEGCEGALRGEQKIFAFLESLKGHQ